MRRARRWILGAIAGCGIGGPWLTSCSSDFDAPSRIEGIRILAVTPDGSYASPGDTVHFQMTWDAGGSFAGSAPQILWLGGCFDPDGDTYYGCYSQFADLFTAFQNGEPIDPHLLIAGRELDQFDLDIPKDIVANHPPPATGSNYGVAFVFFAVCAGQFRIIPVSDAGLAGSFPIACFDADGNQVGADGFVPGFTQIYSFADGRKNENPPAKSLKIRLASKPNAAFTPLSDQNTKPFSVEACNIDEDARRKLGCGNHPFTTCTAYEVDVEAGSDVSELDPGSEENGKLLHEAVWVDWYTDGGDFDGDVSLIYDPQKGLVSDRSVQWIAPVDKGEYSIWGVVHDARGGDTVLRGYLEIK